MVVQRLSIYCDRQYIWCLGVRCGMAARRVPRGDILIKIYLAGIQCGRFQLTATCLQLALLGHMLAFNFEFAGFNININRIESCYVGVILGQTYVYCTYPGAGGT